MDWDCVFENYLQEFCEINKLKGILYAAIMNYYKSMNAEDFGREFADRGVRNFGLMLKDCHLISFVLVRRGILQNSGVNLMN